MDLQTSLFVVLFLWMILSYLHACTEIPLGIPKAENPLGKIYVLRHEGKHLQSSFNVKCTFSETWSEAGFAVASVSSLGICAILLRKSGYPMWIFSFTKPSPASVHYY
jgi:hypothetical protein